MLLRNSVSNTMMRELMPCRLNRIYGLNQPSPNKSLTASPSASAAVVKSGAGSWLLTRLVGHGNQSRASRLSSRRRRRQSQRIAASSLVGARHKPVNDRVHEGEDGRHRVKQGEVELLAQAAHISGKRHEPDQQRLDATTHLAGVGIVQVRKGPGLAKREQSRVKAWVDVQPTQAMTWNMAMRMWLIKLKLKAWRNWGASDSSTFIL